MSYIIVTQARDEAGPVWCGGSAGEQGYKNLPLPRLRRHDSRNDEYYVYTSKTEYQSVIAESAILAVTESKVEDPLKVVHAHARIAAVMDTKKLEYMALEEPAIDQPEAQPTPQADSQPDPQPDPQPAQSEPAA